MDQYQIFVTVVVAVVIVAAIVLVKVFKVFNSPDGERYRRMTMQGPFVPLSEEEVAADRRRIEASRTDSGGKT